MAKEVDLSVFNPTKLVKCTFCLAYDKLSPEQRELVKQACDSPEIRSVMIQRRIQEWSGLRVAKDAVARHRTGECIHV